MEKYYGIIQKDNIGNIIDIIELSDSNRTSFDSFKNDDNYIVLPLKEAIDFSKKNPSKKFFTYGAPVEVIDLLKENGITV